MKEKYNKILIALEETPRILKELISEISPELYAKRIINGKWTIHENATHIAVTDKHGFQKRLELFKHEISPEVEPLSGDDFDCNFFMNLKLNKTIDDFFEVRQQTVDLAKSLNQDDWDKKAIHPEYKIYTPYIMLRHLLMHDHSHLYKIEDMGFGIGHIK